TLRCMPELRPPPKRAASASSTSTPAPSTPASTAANKCFIGISCPQRIAASGHYKSKRETRRRRVSRSALSARGLLGPLRGAFFLHGLERRFLGLLLTVHALTHDARSLNS